LAHAFSGAVPVIWNERLGRVEGDFVRKQIYEADVGSQVNVQPFEQVRGDVLGLPDGGEEFGECLEFQGRKGLRWRNG